MNENTKNYYIKNQNNEQEMMLIQNETNEEDEDNDIKYIFGIKTHLSDFIFLTIYLIVIYIIFIKYIFPFFNSEKYILIYIIIKLSITLSLLIGLYNQMACFLIEPGIIPRNYSSLKIRDFNDKIIYSKITRNPIIRVQRNCSICSIRRPKKCQHCFFCDNCVEEFDHHCQYVSNCIGKRNKKYFLFFIIFDFIFLIQIYFISFFQLCFSFKVYKDDILEVYNIIYISIIFLSIIIILLLANIFFTFDYNGYLIYILYFANFIFIISFYSNKKNDLPIFISPFNIVLLNILFQWIYYFLIQIIHQMKMIAFNMTSSQYKYLISYLKIINNDESYAKLTEDNNNNNDDEDNNDLTNCTIIKDLPIKKEIPKFNVNNLMKNLKNLIFKDVSPSLIYKK